MMPVVVQGEELHAALVAQLVRDGRIRSPEWADAFARTPREILVPRFYERDTTGAWQLVDQATSDQHERWLTTVYSNQTLIIQLGEVAIPVELGGGSEWIWLSSSTVPDLVARMLEDLDVQHGHNVLEIGTGSGYNTALLCARLGARNVTSLDISADLIDDARPRLASLGHQPTLVACDGSNGYPENAPYDRLIATCAVPDIPLAWLEQVRPGGIILADWRRHIGGTLVRLFRRADGTAEGRFMPEWASFMYLRRTASPTPRAEVELDAASPVTERTTHVDPALIVDDYRFIFLVQLCLPDGRVALTTSLDDDRPAVRLVTDDGSWCEVERHLAHGRRRVVEGGPRVLWSILEEAHDWWQAHDQPSWQDYGMTVTSDIQTVWYATPQGRNWTIRRCG